MEAPPVSVAPASLRCISVGLTRIMLMSLFILSRAMFSSAFKVIGGNRTIMQGGTVTLPCELLDSMESVTQITWQRETREKTQTDSFFTILPEESLYLNGKDKRFKFIGSFIGKDGSLQFADVQLKDEGVYCCNFILFPSGKHTARIYLNLLVPPVSYVEDNLPVLGDKEVPLANCTAAGSRPPAEVRWLTDSVAEKVHVKNINYEHANGTTTTVSTLFGVPAREIYQESVQCVITGPALLKEETISFFIQVYFPPTEMNIEQLNPDSLQCVTDANPSANFNWSRVGKSWPQSAVKVEGGTLQFLRKSSDMNGLYQCEAFNKYGKQQAYIYVDVTTGTCLVYQILLGLLFSLIVVVSMVWYLYKNKISPRAVEVKREEMQRIPISPIRFGEQINVEDYDGSV